MPDTPYTRLQSLGLELPKAPLAAANYVPFVLDGSLLFIAGQLPYSGDGTITHTGKLGAELTLEDGRQAARLAGLNIIAQAQAALGDLAKVKRILRLNGFVAVAPGFIDVPLVINGASDLLFDVFGEAGRHTRIAVGVSELPRNAAVEIDAILSVA